VSADEVACVDRFFAAFSADDVEGALSELHPDAELEPMRAQLEDITYRGHDGYRRLVDDLSEDWSSMQVEIEEHLDGEECLVILARLQVQGRASGVDVDIPMGWVWRFRDGRIVYGKAYSERADALAVAGLEASAGTTG
jgi:ketosteroid isomerase-like protein